MTELTVKPVFKRPPLSKTTCFTFVPGVITADHRLAAEARLYNLADRDR